MEKLNSMLAQMKTIVLVGHIHPDGDCIGSSLGLYNYLSENYPDLSVDLYLDAVPEKFSYLKNFSKIKHENDGKTQYDLCISLDCGDRERLGDFGVFLEMAANSLCIDHHITNTRFANENIVDVKASSTCEVLFELLDETKVSKTVAECLYTGLIHDTGVFKYSNTSARTMQVAGILIGKGIDFTTIIEDSFYKKTYVQNQILGRSLLESVIFLKGVCIFSVVKKKDMEFFGADNSDFDGIVEQLRCTEGVECAIFMYETASQEYKVSLRSNKYIDVSKVAAYFGGGGHIRAAGCTMAGSIYDVVNNLSAQLERQISS